MPVIKGQYHTKMGHRHLIAIHRSVFETIGTCFGYTIAWFPLLVLMTAPWAGNLLQLGLSRTREYSADLEAARRLVYYAAWLKDAGEPHMKESAMAKLFASEKAAEICDKAARIFASYGFAMEFPIQRLLRDVRFTLIGGGTSEILKLVIAKEALS